MESKNSQAAADVRSGLARDCVETHHLLIAGVRGTLNKSMPLNPEKA